MKFGEIMDEAVSDVMSVLPGSVFQSVEVASEPYYMLQGSVQGEACVRVRSTKSIYAKIMLSRIWWGCESRRHLIIVLSWTR